MNKAEPIKLIEAGIKPAHVKQSWADLGCGSGVFTEALAMLLPNGSHIYAIDKHFYLLPKLLGNDVSVEFVKSDFGKSDFNFSNLDGILMANSLHYVEDKETVVLALEKYLSPNKKFIIVEYDTEFANQWVPYPISFENLKYLFSSLNNSVIKISEVKSIYGQGNIYAANIYM